jgi:hypothetical protein
LTKPCAASLGNLTITRTKLAILVNQGQQPKLVEVHASTLDHNRGSMLPALARSIPRLRLQVTRRASHSPNVNANSSPGLAGGYRRRSIEGRGQVHPGRDPITRGHVHDPNGRTWSHEARGGVAGATPAARHRLPFHACAGSYSTGVAPAPSVSEHLREVNSRSRGPLHGDSPAALTRTYRRQPIGRRPHGRPHRAHLEVTPSRSAGNAPLRCDQPPQHKLAATGEIRPAGFRRNGTSAALRC